MRVLTDADVRAASPTMVVAAAREALACFADGQLAAPPRQLSDLGDVAYVFTVGALAGGASGFRVYRSATAEPGDQLTAVWDDRGSLTGVIVGDELGARRTGALGGVAADVLARRDASVIGVVGSGKQAWTQLWALTAVRRASDVRVFSREPEHRQSFADRATAELALPARAVASAAEAVSDADIILIATRSAEPVIAAEDVGPGAHVTTVGPKLRSGHEAPLELVAAAAVTACDSVAQARAYGEPFFTDPDGLTSLGDIVTGRAPGRRGPADITLYCSVGLAGSEVVLASALLRTA